MEYKHLRIKLAELIVDVGYHHYYEEPFFEEYLYEGDEPADITVLATPELIEEERVFLDNPDTPDDLVENTTIFRHIAEELPRFNTLLVHGSTIAVDGRAYIFSAPSGTGKSTHTRYWQELLKHEHDVFLINDDKPLLKFDEQGVRVFGSPWKGKSIFGRNVSMPLACIGIVNRADEPWIKELPTREIMSKLMPNVYRPRNVAAIRETFTMLYKLPLHVEIFDCGCTRDVSSAQLTYTVMSKRGDKHMKLKNDYMSYEAEDETILIATGDAVQDFHGLVRLNETAAFMLSCLADDVTESEIIERVMSEFNAKREDVEEDVASILKTLRDIGAIDED